MGTISSIIAALSSIRKIGEMIMIGVRTYRAWKNAHRKQEAALIRKNDQTKIDEFYSNKGEVKETTEKGNPTS